MVGPADEGRLVAGRYRLQARIGRGGMGTVWRAQDELLDRQVAVKKLHPPQPDMHDDELATLFERTRREARAAARISHPNVIVVHDVVDDAGLPSIVMEYVPSVTLGELLKQRGALPPPEAARIGRGMIAALIAAHRAGVLHRDVKPGNVLLGNGRGPAPGPDTGPQPAGPPGGGRIVLTDFGIAQASGTSTLTRTGEIIGSIDFLAPERLRGAPPGPEADLWALGATLYQAVEGSSPFRRPTAIETAYAIAEEVVLPPPGAGALSDVIAGLLAKEPAERLSAEEAERMLRIPAADPDTALVERTGLTRVMPPTAAVGSGAAPPPLVPPPPAGPVWQGSAPAQGPP
ncbi:MAG: serine/threonine protein kinase, partial [Streptomyces sp.]|nr:serine/threonine protein kinase [Streptomyces sp.]